MNTDCIYSMGKLHSVNQDYVRSGDSYCLLSDGCSGSPDTDVGSRILVLSACEITKLILKDSLLDSDFEKDVKKIFLSSAFLANNRIKSLGLNTESIDATLLLILTNGSKVFLGMMGDGILAYQRNQSNTIEAYDVSFLDNCPYYPSYLVDSKRKRRIIEGNKIVRKIELSNETVSIEQQNEIMRENVPLWLEFSVSELKFAAILSDGVGSMTQKTIGETFNEEKIIDYKNCLLQMLSFKNFNGVFVQRRIKSFLRESKKNGMEFNDDISVAAMHFG